MFKEERKQYAEDCKNYERPWELWEYKAIAVETWKTLPGKPIWHSDCIYRRKQTTFVPEYYSGLNWRNAEYLIGKTVECTNNPDCGWAVGTLKIIAPMNDTHFGMTIDNHTYFYTYIRTYEETYQHPIINIGGVELPKPETVAPSHGTKYWTFPGGICQIWNGFTREIDALHRGQVHLTEDMSKAWADWWRTNVIDKMERN